MQTWPRAAATAVDERLKWVVAAVTNVLAAAAAGRYTPLHRACWGAEPRHTETVAVLLEAGVPHDQRGPDGGTPADMSRGNQATRRLLKRWAKKQPAAK